MLSEKQTKFTVFDHLKKRKLTRKWSTYFSTIHSTKDKHSIIILLRWKNIRFFRRTNHNTNSLPLIARQNSELINKNPEETLN